MFSDAQIHYLEEVLGASSTYFQVTDSQAEALEQGPAILVVTTHLGADEQALLSKILGSIGLKDFEHRQVEVVSDVISDLDFSAAPHVFVFDSGQRPERTEGEICIWWTFPAIQEMLGADAQVTALKKGTWTLLQQYAKEVRR